MPFRIVRAVAPITLLLATGSPSVSSDDGAPLAARRREPTAIITGRVVDSATTQPLASTYISIRETTLGVQSDAQGYYRLIVPVDSAKGRDIALIVRRIGFNQATRNLHVTAGPRTENFALVSAQLRLESVVVTGNAAIAARKQMAAPAQAPPPPMIGIRGQNAIASSGAKPANGRRDGKVGESRDADPHNTEGYDVIV